MPNNAQQQQTRQRRNIILGITGSIAAVKGPELALLLQTSLSANVIIVTTNTGQYFWDECSEQYNPTHFQNIKNKLILGKDILLNVNGNAMDANTNNSVDRNSNAQQSFLTLLEQHTTTNNEIILFQSKDEWINYKSIGDPVLHILLRDWADIALIAPLSANTLSKISNGSCDDTLSCILRAWDFKNKPIYVAPAMNTGMWNHRITKEHLDKLASFFEYDNGDDKKDNCTSSSLFTIIYPQGNKTLACGEVGTGAMADLHAIVESIKSYDISRIK